MRPCIMYQIESLIVPGLSQAAAGASRLCLQSLRLEADSVLDLHWSQPLQQGIYPWALTNMCWEVPAPVTGLALQSVSGPLAQRCNSPCSLPACRQQRTETVLAIHQHTADTRCRTKGGSTIAFDGDRSAEIELSKATKAHPAATAKCNGPGRPNVRRNDMCLMKRTPLASLAT